MIYNKNIGKVVLEDKNIIGTQISEFDNLEYVLLELKGESRISKHQLPIDVDFFVISGSGSIEVGDEIRTVESGDLIRVEKGTPRGVISHKGEEIKVLVIKNKL